MGNRQFGFMLSGGLDSSLIAAIASKFLLSKPVAFSVGLIQRKLECSLVAIAETAPRTNAQQVALDRTRQNLDRLQSSPPQTLKALLGLEADTAARYFAAWHGAPRLPD